jgi:hypothetical protein
MMGQFQGDILFGNLVADSHTPVRPPWAASMMDDRLAVCPKDQPGNRSVTAKAMAISPFIYCYVSL